MKKIAYYIILLLSFNLMSCEDPNADSDYAVREGEPIGSYLEKDDRFSDWVSLLRRTDMFSILNVKTTFTCFVPTNDAVKTYLDLKGYKSPDEITQDEAVYLVKYHTLNGSEFPTKLMTNGKLSDTTASGDYLVTQYQGINIIVNNYTRIAQRDIKVLNGYIHVLDKMLNPATNTIWGSVSANPRYSIYTGAIQKAGLEQKLSTIERLYTGGKAFITAMIVPDEVFRATGMNSVQDLIDEYSPNRNDYAERSNPFYKYVAYHLLAGMQSYNDLVDFDKGKNSKNIETLANNELMMTEDVNGTLVINRDTAQKQYIHLVDSVYNRQAINGMYHEIDHVMPVFSPPLLTVKIELTDKNYYPEYASISFYRSGGGTYDLDSEKFPFVRWQTIPEGGGTVQYHRRTGWSAALDYSDIVQSNLGAIGWVEFDLPAIVKGKYRVTINNHHAPTRGAYQFSFDPKNGDSGKNIGAPVDFHNTGYAGKKTTLGIVNFTENSTHVFRATVVKSGLMELDYILFEPVN